MPWLSDRLSENNSKLAFGVIAGGAIFVLNNPTMMQAAGWAVWGPFLGGILSQLVHILIPAENATTLDAYELGPLARTPQEAATLAAHVQERSAPETPTQGTV